MRRATTASTTTTTTHEHDEVEEPMRRELPSVPRDAPVLTKTQAPQIRAKGLEKQSLPSNLKLSAPSEDGEVVETGGTVTTADDPYAGVGRNAKCPCGSGKKFKQCHGAPGGPTGLTARMG